MELARAVADCTAIFRAAVASVDPETLVRDALRVDGRTIVVRDQAFPLHESARVVVLAVGKAAGAMARGAEAALGDRIDGGVAVTKRGTAARFRGPRKIRLLEAGHPVPDDGSVVAGQAVLDAVAGLTAGDLVLALISGGGSALIEAPVNDVSLPDIAAATDALLRAGASIQQLNAVRQRLSRIKGGGLARAIAPARILNLIVSDVLGNPLEVIASGPTVVQVMELDPVATVRSLGAWEALPDAARAVLSRPRALEDDRGAGSILGTWILADAAAAAEAAARAAESRGYTAAVLGTQFEGEARAFAGFWTAIARHVRETSTPFCPPVCLIGAGEMTVTVRGWGTGGRNTEMALASALAIAGHEGIAIASLATDGDDGTTGAAGGVVVGDSMVRARAAGLDPLALLEDNDSARFLQATGGLVVTGPTGTNVNDVYFALVA